MAGMTFGELQTEVIDWVGGDASDSEYVRRVKAALNGENRRICVMRNWPWMEDHDTAETTATTVDLDLPTDCRQGGLFHVVLYDTGEALPFHPFSLEEAEAGEMEYVGRDIPQAWTIIANKMRLLPYPAGAYTLYRYYHKRPTTMTDSGDEPDIPAGYRDVLVAGAVARIAAKDSYDDSIAQHAWAQRKESLAMLMHTARAASPDLYSIPRYRGWSRGGVFARRNR